MPSLTATTVGALFGALSGAALAQQRTTFTAVGQYPGANFSSVRSLSADGGRAVGTVAGPKTGQRAALWERGAGLSLLNIPEGVLYNSCVDVSADGTTFLGQHAVNGLFRASLQTGKGEAADIGLIAAGVGVLPYALSADGRFVVGEAEFPGTIKGFVWDAATQEFRALEGFDGKGATAWGVSRDGAVIVGECTGFSGQVPVTHSAVWTEGSTVAQSLEGDNFSGMSRALAVSDNGEWIVGTRGDTNGRIAFRWSQATGFETLGAIGENFISEAVSVSADGSVVVGLTADLQGDRPFIWRDGHGMTELRHLLRQRNAFPSSWSGLVVYGVSADGTTVCGFGGHNGLYEGFVVTIGCFSDYDNNGFLNGIDFDSYVRQFELGTFRADLNADGFVTGEDFDNFVTGFLEGC